MRPPAGVQGATDGQAWTATWYHPLASQPVGEWIVRFSHRIVRVPMTARDAEFASADQIADAIDAELTQRTRYGTRAIA